MEAPPTWGPPKPAAGRGSDRRSPRREPSGVPHRELAGERACLADAPAVLLLQLEAPLDEQGRSVVACQAFTDKCRRARAGVSDRDQLDLVPRHVGALLDLLRGPAHRVLPAPARAD